MTGRRALVVAVNPMPRLYLEGLARTLIETHHVTVVTFYRSLLLEHGLVSRLRSVGCNVIQYTFDGHANYFRQLHRAGASIRAWLSLGGDMDVFYCQPNHILTNYLTFAGRCRQTYACHLLPDGLANFYMTDLGPYQRNMRLKAMAGMIVGMPFRRYGGNYLALGEADYSSYWFVRDPGIMRQFLPCREFPVRDGPAVEKTERWLFLGQPIPNATAELEFSRVLQQAASQFGPGGDYKPHPAEEVTEERSQLIRALGMSIVHTNDSAERFAAAYSRVAGVSSSVMANLRILGWGQYVFGVLDPERLALLSGRSVREMQEVAAALDSLGVRSV